jgi:(E)-4-hydroxy-3-methylbut-2-enyl-diphosphate synthase
MQQWQAKAGFTKRGATDHHHVQDAEMIGHIVRLVEDKAAEIEAALAAQEAAA